MSASTEQTNPSVTEVSADLLAAIAARDPVSGYTHNFYRYPARFSPLFVREVIRQYSRPGDVVLDPFMGGGTAIVEALAMRRKAIGIDLNSLAHFVASVKTRPLSIADFASIQEWDADMQENGLRGEAQPTQHIRNLPPHLKKAWGNLIAQLQFLPLERQRNFVKCALLKTGQSGIDCKNALPSKKQTLTCFSEHLQQMISGMKDFVSACQSNGVNKNKIRQHRWLFCRSTAGLEIDERIQRLPKPKLVVTSPPYPAVHILYHRWQVQGRRETPAPYWLAALKDGHAASHYTFGSRSTLGLENYFRNVEECFRSVRQVVAPDAVIVQLVAFSESSSQLPQYLAAMKAAGFAEGDALDLSTDSRVWRKVPNRKWYCHNGKDQDSAKEVVLFHRPA